MKVRCRWSVAEYLLPAALGLAAVALLLGRCRIGLHAWRERGATIRCARCSRWVPRYSLHTKGRR